MNSTKPRSELKDLERQELLSALDRKVKEFIVLHEVAQIATESLDLNKVLNEALNKVLDSVRPEVAAIILADDNGDKTAVASRDGIPPELLDAIPRILKETGDTARIVLSPVPVVIEDFSKYPQFISRAMRDSGLRSIAAFPLKSGGGIIGTMLVASQGYANFSPQDIQMLGIISEGLGPALKSAQLQEALREKSRQLSAQNMELVKQKQELLDKTREAEEANRLKSEFLARISHELRTPLNVIIGFSELMLDGIPGPINDDQKECLDDILASGRHLLHLIDEVIDLSRIETGRLELHRKTVAPGDIIEWARNAMLPIVASRKQVLEVTIEPLMPPLYADKVRLRQVLLNLLSNATKFTPDGGKIAIEAAREADFCRISVSDNGIGIKHEDQATIFEPFYQLNYPPAEGKPGSGLGLSVARQIVERHGGQIWVESEYGRGSHFNFTIPLAEQLLPPEEV